MLILAFALELVLAEPRVIDGDTVAAGGVSYRVLDLDAPERGARARCAAERALGELAAAQAQSLVAGAHRVTVELDGAQDRYGRTLARVLVDGRDFRDAMISAGVARAYTAGGKRWCS